MLNNNSILTSISFHLAISLITRIGFILFGIWQDSVLRVKYTDIDYHVFTDAARYVTLGQSPYDRATYRYTPLLAWFLTPNIYLHETFGKFIFVACDVLTGYMIYLLVKLQRRSETQAVICAVLWLYNPLPITVSSRGNAESLLSLLILSSFYCLTSAKRSIIFLGYVLYGVTVHFKIYPITYALPMYLMYKNAATPSGCPWHQFTALLWPNKRRLQLALTSASVFFLLTGFCYILYGDQFLDETYFYHITRRDTKHNFSVYFYLLYLFENSDYSYLLGLVTFVPQVSLLILSSFRYYEDLPFCCFLNTAIFVTYNKVCTSQYFLWYLCLLPIAVPQITMTVKRATILLVLWFAGQALWLCPAYYYEFEGHDTLLYVWLASILFFLINNIILYNIVSFYEKTVFPIGMADSKEKMKYS